MAELADLSAAMAEIADVIAAIEALNDLDALRTLTRAIEERAKEIREARAQKAISDRWAKLERCKPGAILYCCSAGVHIGSAVQCGDSFKVVRVDRERERLWVTLHKIAGKLSRSTGQFVLTPAQCARYTLERERPEESLDESKRKMAASLAKMLDGA